MLWRWGGSGADLGCRVWGSREAVSLNMEFPELGVTYVAQIEVWALIALEARAAYGAEPALIACHHHLVHLMHAEMMPQLLVFSLCFRLLLFLLNPKP